MFLATTAKITALALTGAAVLTLAFGAFGAPQSVLEPADPIEEQESGYLGVTLTDPGLTIATVINNQLRSFVTGEC